MKSNSTGKGVRTIYRMEYDAAERKWHCYPRNVSNDNNPQVCAQEDGRMRSKAAIPMIALCIDILDAFHMQKTAQGTHFES